MDKINILKKIFFSEYTMKFKEGFFLKRKLIC